MFSRVYVVVVEYWQSNRRNKTKRKRVHLSFNKNASLEERAWVYIGALLNDLSSQKKLAVVK